MMYESQPMGTEAYFATDFGPGTVDFYSDVFPAGSSIQAGTTTVYINAYTPSTNSSSITWRLYAGSTGSWTELGSGFIPVPFFTGGLVQVSFSTSSYVFAGGEQLRVEASVAQYLEISWDGSSNYSRVEMPSITVPTPSPSSTPTATATDTPTPTATDTPTPTPTDTPAGPQVDVQVSASSDDAVRWGVNSFLLDSPNDWVDTFNTPNSSTGLRFTGVTVPNGATITTAYLTLRARFDAMPTEGTTILGEDADDPITFSTFGDYDFRVRTTAYVSWSPAAWVADTDYNSSDLSAVVQEIVNRPGWASGNALALFLVPEGNQNIWAYSYDSSPSYAPKLHIEYVVPSATPTATDTPLPTSTPTATPTATPTSTATATPTATSTPTSTPIPSCTVVQSATGVTDGGALVSASFASAPTANNLLVAIAGNRDAATVSAPSGWSVAISQTNNTPGQAIFYKFAGAAESTTVTVSGYSPSTRLGLSIYEYCGIDSASPLNDSGSSSGTGTTVSSGGINTTQANTLIVVGLVTNAETAFASWSNGFSELADFANAGAPPQRSSYGGADLHATGTGIYFTTATTTVSAAWRGQIVAFNKRPPLTYEQSAYRWFANQDGVAAFGTGGIVTGNSTSAGVFGMAIDTTYMYIVGEETGPNWRIEKRRLDTGALETAFDTDGIINGVAGSQRAEDIAIDSTYMYVVGFGDGTPGWRIEKRRLDTGALETAFDSDGIITEAAGTAAEGVSIDGTYLYVVGNDASGFRIEKRRLDTGALVTTFDGDGIITGGGGFIAREIAIDSTYMYLAGYETALTWRIEKRRLDTGALVTAFDGDGIISNGTGLRAYGIAIDSTYMYVGGEVTAGATRDWRIEKRLLDTGALDTTFGSSGVVTSAGGYRNFQVGRDSTYLYVVGDDGDPAVAADWRTEKRLQSTGALDASFGTGGAVTSATPSESAWDVAVGSTYLYVAGYDQTPDIRIEKRLLSDGSLVQQQINVGAPLAGLNTPATAPAQGTPFRLRLLIHVGGTELWLGEGNFKLQFAQRSGTCDAGFDGESYVDVTGSTAIGFYDDAVAADGWALTTNANDPTHGTDSVVAQTFEEANSFTNAVAAFGPSEDGLWDFALVDLTAPTSTTYCFRVVDGSSGALDVYSAIAEITTAP